MSKPLLGLLIGGLLGILDGLSASFSPAARPMMMAIVLRQFHTEGFVNQYVLDPVSASGKLVLVTEAVENIPAGWRARETYMLTGSDQLEEILEPAPPGKEFEPYSHSRLTRTRL
jgi:hypothetical protein